MQETKWCSLLCATGCFTQILMYNIVQATDCCRYAASLDFSPLYTFVTLNLNSQREFYAYFAGVQWPDAVDTSLLSGGVVRVKGRDLNAAVMRERYTHVNINKFRVTISTHESFTEVKHEQRLPLTFLQRCGWLACWVFLGWFVSLMANLFHHCKGGLFYLEQEVWRSCTNQ